MSKKPKNPPKVPKLILCGENDECFYWVRPGGNVFGVGDLATLLTHVTGCTTADAQHALWMLEGFGGLRKAVSEIRAGLVTGDESKLKKE